MMTSTFMDDTKIEVNYSGVSNILNNYNIEYKASQDEEFFIFKIRIFS